jgi:hypothetical protein
MPAATVPAAYVRARWAYSELLSCRPYRGIGVQELKRKAKGHVPFDDLRGEERDQLEQAWYRVRGVPTFINAFAGIATFELVQWSKEQLGAVYVIKFFAQEVGNHSVPMSFKQWIETEPSDSIELGHARHAALGAVPSTGVEQLLLANYHVVATTSEQSSSKINLHRGNGIPRPRDKTAQNRLQARNGLRGDQSADAKARQLRASWPSPGNLQVRKTAWWT